MIYYSVQHFGDHQWLPWLAKRLEHPENTLLIRYDGLEAEIDNIRAAVAAVSPVFRSFDVESSGPVRWAGPSQVTAQIRAIERALETDGWEYFINLSGACAPLTSQARIREDLSMLKSRDAYALIHSFPVMKSPTFPEPRGPESKEIRNKGRLLLSGNPRILDQFFDESYFPVKHPRNRPFIECLEPGDKALPLAIDAPEASDMEMRVRFFEENRHYCGRAWYCLHRSCCEALISYLRSAESESVKGIFLSSFEPDESFIPTILMNDLCFSKEKILNHNYRTFGGAPRLIDDNNYLTLIEGKTDHFARKIVHGNARALRAHLEAASA